MLEINKVITLGNDEEYLVIETITKDDKDYYYIAEVNSTKQDIVDNYKIVTTEMRDDGVMIINEITGEDKLKEILPLFLEKFG